MSLRTSEPAGSAMYHKGADELQPAYEAVALN